MKARERQPTVFVVDDDAGARSSLRLLLKSMGLQAVTYESGAAFLNDYDAEQPGCLLLDVRMPGMTGPELQQELNNRGAILPVIFITGHGDVAMAVEVMRHGASDFLQKPFRDQELLDRVQRALKRDAANRAELGRVREIRERLGTLTPREHEVLTLLSQGNPNKVMAHRLGISQRTVEIHRARIMEKMHAVSLAHLVRMAAVVAPEQTPHAA
jgi:FixJ family two-component response regulator